MESVIKSEEIYIVTELAECEENSKKSPECQILKDPQELSPKEDFKPVPKFSGRGLPYLPRDETKYRRRVKIKKVGNSLPIKSNTYQSCPKCLDFFENRHFLQIHLVRCNKPFACKICGKAFTIRTFTELRMYEEHELAHKNQKKNQCLHCNVSFESSSQLKQHEESHYVKFLPHVLQNGSDNSIELPTPTSSTLIHLQPLPCIKRPTKCPLCKSEFDTNENLHIHFRECHKLLVCEICDKRFRRFDREQLEKHMKSHSEPISEKELVVKTDEVECSKVANDELIVNERTRYFCAVCCACYYSEKRLAEHMKRHKIYSCTICTAFFHLLVDLLKHEAQEHQDASQLPFQCAICQKSFSSEINRKTHEEIFHAEHREELIVSSSVSTIVNVNEEEVYIVSEVPESSGTEDYKINDSTLSGNDKTVSENYRTVKVYGINGKMLMKMLPTSTVSRNVKPVLKKPSIARFNSKKQNPQKLDSSNYCLKRSCWFCIICNATFSHFNQLKSHHENNHVEKKCRCGICRKTFESKAMLEDHMKYQCKSDFKTWQKSFRMVKKISPENNTPDVKNKSSEVKIDENAQNMSFCEEIKIEEEEIHDFEGNLMSVIKSEEEIWVKNKK